jgi:SPP1 gp7 family putative phage head morphogenesis protein
MQEAYLIVMRGVHAELIGRYVQDSSGVKSSWIKRAMAWVRRAVGTIQSSVDEDAKKLPSIPQAKVAGGAAAVRAFETRNAGLIKTIAAEHTQRVADVVREAGGAHVKGLAAKLQLEFAISESKAKFWARDQTLKLHADIVQSKHQQLGITHYVWRTSQDGTVRHDHSELNGKTFAYSDPPVVNASRVARGEAPRKRNPGKDYECRCHADPVLPTAGAVEQPARALATAEQVPTAPTTNWSALLQPRKVAPLPEVLPEFAGSPILPEPFIPARAVPNTAGAEKSGAALRAKASAAEIEVVESMRYRLKSSADLAEANEKYMSKQFSGSDPLVDAEAQLGAKTFTANADFSLMRRYMRGETRVSMISERIKYGIEATKAQVDVDRSIRATHELERAFNQAEDSPIKTVYRGIGGYTDAALNKLLGSETYSMRGAASSTSSEFDIGLDFARAGANKRKGHGVVFKFERKSKGLGVAAISEYVSEKEVIVHGNTQWKITSRERLADFQPGQEMWLIRAIEVL